MAILPIIKAPDPRLKTACEPVEAVDADLRRLMDDMLETMYAAPGVGLAAPQIGVTKRILVMDVARHDEERTPLRIVNPEIIEASGAIVSREEGCLSFPDQFAEVERPETVRVRYTDENNEIQELAAEGLAAICVQHEMDHLDGVLLVDRISVIKRNMIMRKMKKLKKAAAG